jgi:hypothetical protein
MRPSVINAQRSRLLVGIVTGIFLAIHTPIGTAQSAKCPFDKGDAQTLTRCLLRPVKKKGILEKDLSDFPTPLDALIGKPMNISRESLQKFLKALNIPEAAVGGPVSIALPEPVRFFVIHDTSSPYLGDKNFPVDIEERTWKENNLMPYPAVAHVFVNRIGESLTKVNFAVKLMATKHERDDVNQIGKFVHVEMLQPRRRDPAGPLKNDFLAPEPGFPQAQLDRLALLYLVASVRRGAWLIPGFHCAIDAGIPGAHDDPQNFDLNAWLKSLRGLLTSLGFTL